MDDTNALRVVMQREYSMAKRFVFASELLQLVTIVAACYAIAQNDTKRLYIGTVAFLVPVLLLLLKEIGSKYQSAGDIARRLLLTWEGLGQRPEDEELTNVHGRASAIASKDPDPAAGYYTSNLAPGHQRLAEHLQESAFFTKEEAHTARTVYAVLTLVGLIATIGFGWYWIREQPLSGTAGAGVLGAQLFSTLLLFFGTGHALQSWLSFWKLKDAAETTFQKAGQTKRTKEDEIDRLKLGYVLSSYETACAKAPPIPGWAYRIRGTKLANTWSSIMVKPAG